MRIYWLNPPISTRSCIADTAWINFSAILTEHEWIEPIIDWSPFKTVEDVVEHILEYRPDLLCISTYMWNERLCVEVAKQVSKHNVKVVRGGPQQTMFDGIDYNCDPMATGEDFLKEFLKNLETPSLKLKQKYNFPDFSTYEYNIEYLTNVVGTANRLNKLAVAHLETTRGCPYSCTYCEWGGGIGTKISIKPIDVVFKEIDILTILGYNNIDIIDANFGILDRDIDIINRLVENKKTFGYPQNLYIYGIAKVKVEKREKILDAVFANNLADSYPMSLQTISTAALTNVKRTDISIEENLRLAEKYYKKYNIYARAEIILGLPGSTIDDFYKEMDLSLITKSWDWGRTTLAVLPETELADKFYQKMYKIKTAVIGTTENEYDRDSVYYSDCVLTKFRSPQEVVIETYSYTVEDWKEMFFMNYAQRILGPRIKDGELPSKRLREFYQEIQDEDWFREIKKDINLLVEGKRIEEDFLLFNGRTIEEWVEDYLNGPNNKAY